MPGRMLPLVLLLMPTLVLAAAVKHVRHDHWTDKYDRHFRKYAKHYFGPGFEWRWFKAQGIAESGLRPDARSSAGARGLMQIMPSTFEEIKRDNPHFLSIDDPHWNIAAGIYYDRKLYRRWQANKVAGDQRLDFSFASYNAGYSKVRRAFRKASQASKKQPAWGEVAPFTPRETRRYVARIKRLMQQP